MRENSTFEEIYKQIFKKIRSEILTENDSEILGCNSEDLAEFYSDKHCFTPLKIDDNENDHWEHKKFIKTIRRNNRDPAYRYSGDLEMECETIILTIPLIFNKNTVEILTTPSKIFASDALRTDTGMSISKNNVIYEFEIKGYRINLSDDQIKQELLSVRNQLTKIIADKEQFIKSQNDLIQQQIITLIEERKTKIKNDQNRLDKLTQKITIPLKRKNEEFVKKVRINKKPLVKKIKPKPELPTEYILDGVKVMDILSILNNQGLQFEKTSQSYKQLEEENLRDILLVNLNSIFEGAATGETFSNKGKSDIYLNIDQGNILVCECKFWKGGIVYQNTIDQILGYLTWRNNFGVIITFSKIQRFSKIFEGIENQIKSHSSYNGNFKAISKTHYTSNHRLPIDEAKKVELHHLFYNLYVA
jgi:hypothetical protein